MTAFGTLLDEHAQLHEEPLAIQLGDQWDAGIHGILLGGTMRMTQHLSDQKYQRLVQCRAERGSGKGKILVGAGDSSLARTRDRFHYPNRFKIDGVAVLPPSFDGTDS